MEAFEARFPRTASSATSRRLNELTEPLGIGMFSQSASRSNGLEVVGRFVSAQQRSTDDTARVAPEEVTKFLTEHAKRVDAIEALLLEGSEVVWDQDISAGFGSPLPRLNSHRNLQNVLLARALEEGRRGHLAEASKSLEASWVLNRSLVGRPELISQLVAMAIAWSQNGVLRALPDSPTSWGERVVARDLPSACLRAFQTEAYFMGRTLGPFSTPYTRLCVAGYSDQVRLTAAHLRDSDPCSLDFTAIGRASVEALPKWNFIGRLGMPSLPPAWGSVASARLDGELTRLVMDAQRHPDDPSNSVPVPSRVCTGVSWTRMANTDGTRTVAAQPAQPFRDTRFKRDWTFTLGLKSTSRAPRPKSHHDDVGRGSR